MLQVMQWNYSSRIVTKLLIKQRNSKDEKTDRGRGREKQVFREELPKAVSDCSSAHHVRIGVMEN